MVSMDEVSKKCLREISVSIVWRVALSLVLFFISASNDRASLLRHFAILILVWIVAETLFIFLPNFIRHQRRWELYEDYRIKSSKVTKQDGGLKTIYSKLLDNYPIKTLDSD